MSKKKKKETKNYIIDLENICLKKTEELKCHCLENFFKIISYVTKKFYYIGLRIMKITRDPIYYITRMITKFNEI